MQELNLVHPDANESPGSDTDSSPVPSLPDFLLSAEEIARRAAEIRSKWSVQQRARNRADPVKADITDRLEGFQWPVEAAELADGEDWADLDENIRECR